MVHGQKKYNANYTTDEMIFLCMYTMTKYITFMAGGFHYTNHIFFNDFELFIIIIAVSLFIAESPVGQ